MSKKCKRICVRFFFFSTSRHEKKHKSSLFLLRCCCRRRRSPVPPSSSTSPSPLGPPQRQVRVPRSLLHVQPLLGPVRQARFDKFLGLGRDRGAARKPQVARVSLDDALAQHRLLRAALAEGAPAEEHLVEHDARGPDVDFGGDARRGRPGDVEAFGREVPVGSRSLFLEFLEFFFLEFFPLVVRESFLFFFSPSETLSLSLKQEEDKEKERKKQNHKQEISLTWLVSSVPALVAPSSTTFDKPKSVILTLPAASKRMLAGLRS